MVMFSFTEDNVNKYKPIQVAEGMFASLSVNIVSYRDIIVSGTSEKRLMHIAI